MKEKAIGTVAAHLHDLAERAKIRQMEAKTTADPQTSDIPKTRWTARQTISLVLLGNGSDPKNPTLGMYREPMRGKEKEYPKNYWHAVLGGGRPSIQEEYLTKSSCLESLAYYPELLDEHGKLKPDAYYMLLGKGLLRDGKFPSITYRDNPERAERDLRDALAIRLKMELGMMSGIHKPHFLYDLQSECTAVVGRTLGSYTEAIAKKYKLEIDPKSGALKSMVIEVYERFACALADFDVLMAKPDMSNILTIMDTDAFIAQAEMETSSLESWQNRLQKAGCIRNHSLIRAVEGAVRSGDTSAKASLHRFWNRMKQRWSSGLFSAA